MPKNIFKLSFILINALLLIFFAQNSGKPTFKQLGNSDISSSPSPSVMGESSGNQNQFVVARVIDGDTIELTNGETVRYIGINTPEIKGNKCFSQEAKIKNEELVLGKEIYLEKDVSETDKYRRLLRYVYTKDNQFVNELLVKEGYAQVATYPPDVKYKDKFLQAQKTAREGSFGLWSICE